MRVSCESRRKRKCVYVLSCSDNVILEKSGKSHRLHHLASFETHLEVQALSFSPVASGITRCLMRFHEFFSGLTHENAVSL